MIDALTPQRQEIARRILREICERLQFLVDVGLDYLTLSRGSATLSGGESQRIRLASQIGSGLTGVLYVLDEPSIGLHQRDNERLLGTLRRLRDLGNTVLVVEHDEEAIRAADHLIDMGPGAGIDGGRVVAEGTPAEVAANPKSLTGRLSGRAAADPMPPARAAAGAEGRIAARGRAREQQPEKRSRPSFRWARSPASPACRAAASRRWSVDTLYKAAARRLMGAGQVPALHDAHRRAGAARQDHRHRPVADRADAALQSRHLHRTCSRRSATGSPSCRRPRARLQAGAVQLQRQGRALRGVPGRRRAEDRDALPAGRLRAVRRVQGPALQSRDAGDQVIADKSIAEVLAMTVDEAVPYFCAQTRIHDRLRILQQVGLGYIALGQQATTLSGGEAQRIKLSKELARRATGRTLYILDEPTTGLHFEDVAQAAGGAARAGGPGQHRGGDRAQPGGDQDRRLDPGPGAGGR